MSRDPCIELTEWLLQMCFEVVVKDITVLTKNEVFKLVEGSDGMLGLVLASLSFRFTGAAMTISVASQPEIVDPNPHGTEQCREPLSLVMCHSAVVANAVL